VGVSRQIVPSHQIAKVAHHGPIHSSVFNASMRKKRVLHDGGTIAAKIHRQTGQLQD
jgi:hypothetical protein